MQLISVKQKQETMLTRIERIVTDLMLSDQWLQENLNQSETVKDLCNIVQNNLTEEQFHNQSDEELREAFDRIMAAEIAGKMLDDLTPEQIAIFDEAIKRK